MNELRARVISQEKGIYKISSGAETKAAVVSGKYRYEVQTVSDYPAVGDYVIAEWPKDNSNAVITGLFPRKSCFIHKVKDLKGKEPWEKMMIAKRRKTMVVCKNCHAQIHSCKVST